jgi:hypothetical protein
MDNHEKLSGHPFMGRNFDYVQPVINRAMPKLLRHFEETDEFGYDAAEELGPGEYYHVAVFSKAAAIIGAVERLENSLHYIHTFPRPRAYERKGIHQYAWLQYHYSYFVVTYHGLLDMALILTNSVFQLGIQEKDCRPDIIKSNAWIRNTPVETAIRALEKATSAYGNQRNLFVHRGEMPDVKSIAESDVLDMLELFSTANQQTEPPVPHELLDNAFKNESNRIIAKLSSDVIRARKAIEQLFDTLLPIYERRGRK